MSEAETFNRSDAPRGYGLKLALATTAASIAAGAFWASQNPRIVHPELWQTGGIAAGVFALLLAGMAAKGTGPRARQESRASLVRAGLDAASTLRSQFVEAAKAQTIKTPDAAETPKPSPLESERERLRAAGFSDPEISQILIAKETGQQHGIGGGAPGVMSGVLNNLAAVMSHARNFLPSCKADLAKMLDCASSPLMRIEAAILLVLKCAVVAVLAYIVSMEFTKFKAETDRAKAEACSARMKAIAETLSPSQWGVATAAFERDCGPTQQ